MSNGNKLNPDNPVPVSNTDQEPIKLEPITLVEKSAPLQPLGSKDQDSGSSGIEPSTKIHTFESDTHLGKGTETHYRRELNVSQHGATRVRTFHAKLTDGAMSFLDRQINDWLDENNDIVVKFTSTTIGKIEGKHRTEPHMIISVWY